MASLTMNGNLFEPNQVSLSVTADEAARFFEDHGFFYQEYPDIGTQVDKLYNENRAPGTQLLNFKSTLAKDLRLESILRPYRYQVDNMQFPWGTTPTFYRWVQRSDNRAENGLIVHLVGPGSEWICCDRSHNLVIDSKPCGNGTLEVEEHLLPDDTKKRVEMKGGGVLMVHGLLIHKSVSGRSILGGLLKDV